jgi:hypothetical protein
VLAVEIGRSTKSMIRANIFMIGADGPTYHKTFGAGSNNNSISVKANRLTTSTGGAEYRRKRNGFCYCMRGTTSEASGGVLIHYV